MTAGDSWAWSWGDLPKYDENGEAYAYTIYKDGMEYYTPTYYEGNFNITNTFAGEEGARNRNPARIRAGTIRRLGTQIM